MRETNDQTNFSASDTTTISSWSSYKYVSKFHIPQPKYVDTFPTYEKVVQRDHIYIKMVYPFLFYFKSWANGSI